MKSLREVIEDAPKTMTKEYLQILNTALHDHDLESDTDIDTILSSLLLLIVDPDATVSQRHLATVILQKLSPIKSISEILTLEIGIYLVHALPVLLVQDISDHGTKDLIQKFAWCLCNENWPVEYQWQLLGFISTAVAFPKTPITQDNIKKVCSLMSEWLIVHPAVPSSRNLGFRKSSSSLSITEIDGTNTQDFFTVLNYVSTINPDFMRNIQAFSMLRSFLWNTSECDGKGSKNKHSFVESVGCEKLSLSIREYCMRIVDQVDRKAASDAVAQFQKACLVEAIHLFNIICLMDSGIVHSIFPIIRRIYDHICSSVSKDPEAQDVAVLASAMEFFINHGSLVMHKPDNLYVYLFCDLLSLCYKDNYITYEILQLMKENLSQLCYHSSILEKYFPMFFKVLAWRPCTFQEDFLELLPAFLSQNTAVEVFHTLLDLPCLTAILTLTDNKTGSAEQLGIRDPNLIEALRKPEISSIIKFMLRKTSCANSSYPSVALLHQSFQSLATRSRVTYCAQTVVPLLKKYFEVILQYADATVTSVLIPAILERVSLIFPVPKYASDVHNVLSDAVVQLFELHPETVFHCQKNIISYISHFKNYSIAEQTFIHMVWIIGEYVSVVYSNICRPEIIALFFESLESTTYEALSFLQESSNANFLKLLSVSLTTLSKLAARNQDQVPRAILCLTKVQNQLLLFGNDYKKNWKIVIERVSELLSILNSPSVAAIVLSPPKQLENGRLHRDSTSLPYVLRAITGIVSKSS
ncbi:AP-5 complex subunit zeta-1 [Trichonephila clavata]|uniref:AP-5 complex subunit zeta-1 n=1 Tax=Trichonephila clavata TaxID=2740835 RepID=A0A8X6M1G6_TRICU|nr:AP-5 complex subunit zeta-1 [Trichonephila clavata]